MAHCFIISRTLTFGREAIKIILKSYYSKLDFASVSNTRNLDDGKYTQNHEQENISLQNLMDEFG